MFSIQGGHAACSGGSDGLTVNFILHISCGKDTLDTRFSAPRLCFNIPCLIKFHLAFQKSGVRDMAYGIK